MSYISDFTHSEWISGRTGLPEGVSLKNYMLKNKISQFSKSKLK